MNKSQDFDLCDVWSFIHEEQVGPSTDLASNIPPTTDQSSPHQHVMMKSPNETQSFHQPPANSRVNEFLPGIGSQHDLSNNNSTSQNVEGLYLPHELPRNYLTVDHNSLVATTPQTATLPPNMSFGPVPSRWPASPSWWASNIDLTIKFDLATGPLRYDGRGCYNCSKPGHKCCRCKLVCRAKHKNDRAIENLRTYHAIVLFIQTELDEKVEVLKTALDAAGSTGTWIQHMIEAQGLDVDMEIELGTNHRCVKLDLHSSAILPLPLCENSDERTDSSFDQWDKLVLQLWADELPDYADSLNSMSQKMGFAAMKVVALWKLISNLGRMKVIVPHFGNASPTTYSEREIHNGHHNERVKRLRKLVACNFLISLLSCAQNSVVEFLRLCDMMGQEHERDPMPSRDMRHCLKVIISTLESTRVGWSDDKSDLDPALRDLQRWLQRAGDDTRYQMGLFECYSGYATRSYATRGPEILQFIKKTPLCQNIRLKALAGKDYAQAMDPRVQAYSCPRDILDILSADYVETSLPPNALDNHTPLSSSVPHEMIITPAEDSIRTTQPGESFHQSSVIQKSEEAPTQTDNTSLIYSCPSETRELPDLNETVCRGRTMDGKRAASASPVNSEQDVQSPASSKRLRANTSRNRSVDPVEHVSSTHRVTKNHDDTAALHTQSRMVELPRNEIRSRGWFARGRAWIIERVRRG